MLDKAPFQKGSAGGLLLCCFAFSDPERDARHAKQKPQRLKKKKKKVLFSVLRRSPLPPAELADTQKNHI